MSRKEQAYEYIKKEIVTGKLKGGTPILELELSESLKMSRTPIREALKELEAEGAVVSYASRGTFVTELTPYDVEDIFNLRILLEIWSLERGINRITKEELDVVEKHLLEAEQSGIWDEDYRADVEFHSLIVEKSGSKRLIGFMQILYKQIERISYRAFMNKSYNRDSYEEHRMLVASIREHDLEKGRELLKKHLEAVAGAAIEAFKTV